jgi:uroporphyrinogen III methyltransferase / synthase
VNGRGPLAGRRVVVTRARAQAGELSRALAELGAETIELPVISTAPPADPAALREAARAAGTFDWIVFTSANAVRRFWDALEEGGGDAGGLAGVRVCVVGPATAAALARRGIRPALVPEVAVAEAALQSLLQVGAVRGRRILFPRAAAARSVLPDGLRAAGAEVVEVEAYATVPGGDDGGRLARRLRAGEIDLVTLTSGSTARGFVRVAGTDLGGALVASIGPVTTAAARDLGLDVRIEAREHTAAGLVSAIRDHYLGVE